MSNKNFIKTLALFTTMGAGLAACGDKTTTPGSTEIINPGGSTNGTTPTTIVVDTLKNGQVNLGVYTLFPEGSTGLEGVTRVPHSLSFKDQNGITTHILASPSNNTEMVVDFSANKWQEDAGGDYSPKDANTGIIKLYAKKGGKFPLGNAKLDTAYIKTSFINSSDVPLKGVPTTPLIQLFRNHEEMLSGKNGTKYVGGNNKPYIPFPFKIEL